MTPRELQGLRILVVGAGITGASVIRYLHRQGIAFDLVEEKALPKSLEPLLRTAAVYASFEAQLFASYDVLVLSPGIARAHPAVVAALDAGAVVIGDIELFASVVESPVIAVTGSNGKSTVVSWLASVLQATGEDIVLCGNIGAPALDSLRDSAALYVLELSSYQLESTTRLAPLSAVVLNISDDHMDRYASIDDYANVKRRIYNGCRHIVANADDARTWPVESSAVHGATHAQAAHAPNVASPTLRYFSQHDDSADYKCVSDGDSRWLCHGDERLMLSDELHLPGDHNIANALAVFALLEPLGLDRDAIRVGLIGFHGLPHRTEFIAEHRGVRWYNDSKGTNVDACIKAIEAMSGPVVLIAGGQGKGADFNALRPVVERCVKALILIGQDRDVMSAALHDAARIVLASSMVEAVRVSREIANAGDVVLLSPACASFDMFENFMVRGEQFTEAVEDLAA